MDKPSHKIVYKNPRHQEIMEERLAGFLRTMRADQESQVKKIDERTRLEGKEAASKIISEGVEKLEESSRKKNLDADIEAKIWKSGKINDSRMLKMQTRHQLIQNMRAQLMEKLKQVIKDQKRYKELLLKLIVQGMLKLMDTKVEIKCLKRDIEIVRSVIGEAEAQFNKISSQQTTTKITTKLQLNAQQNLDQEFKNLLGGVVLNSFSGRIVCVNTLDCRFKYCVEDRLPQLREGLFGTE